MSKRRNISKYICIAVMLLALALNGSCIDDSGTYDSNTELFHQDIELGKGDIRNVQIPMSTLFSQKPDLSVHKNAIVVEVQNEVLDRGDSPFSHLLDVQAQMNQAPGEGEPVDLKDIIVDEEGTDMILHYAVYDLCHIDEDAYISLQIEALDGKFRGYVSVEVVDLQAFSIECTDKESETFIPREQHGACESWDSKIWVFGGKRNIKKTEVAMNDIMVLDTSSNSWRSVTPQGGSKPEARFGHAMFCYFQYFIVFGGQNQKGSILGDIWLFDTVSEKWTFIGDNEDSHELSHMGKSTEVPEARAYTGHIMIPELGAGYITGGLTKTGVACDIWGLKIEQIASFVEDKNKYPLDNFWIKQEIRDNDQSFLCRENHLVAQVGEDTFVVWGGLNGNHIFEYIPYTFKVGSSHIQKLSVQGKQPEPRIKSGVLSTGSKMGILYGGVPLGGRGTYIDIWHFMVVGGNTLQFKEIEYEREGDNLFMTWRHGFTLHYVRDIQNPVLVGGTFGNNQQSKALVTLPEKKCKDKNEYLKGECSPCPRGSIYDRGMCTWCKKDQYFRENKKDYFQSQCTSCPLGLVGGYYKSCVPCQGGYMFDLNHPDFCSKCPSEYVCPIGTRYKFSVGDYGENFHEVRLDNLPEMFDPHQKHFDHTSIVVVFISVFSTLILFIVIAILLSMCKEKTLFIFREMDVPFITGQGVKKVVGGVIMAFFILIITIVTSGFFINFFLFNSKTVMFETKNPFLERAYPANYVFKLFVSSSKFIDDEDTSYKTKQEKEKIMNKSMLDLCAHGKITYSLSRYFGQAESFNKKFECGTKKYSRGTNEYILTLTIKDIKDEAPEHAFVRFTIDSEFNQIFHFFKYEYWNIWRYYEDYPISYSKVSGFVTPQMMSKSNHNITSAFRGGDTTQLKFRLTPTHYGNEIESTNFEGYQVFLEDYKRGSVINKRTMASKETPTGEESKGMDIELFSHVGDTINHVQVQRQKSLLETLAYVFGFMAGFVIIAHLMKYFLGKEDYFRGLDRECDTLFGSANTEMLSLNTMPRSDSVGDGGRFMSPEKKEEGKETA